MVSGTIGGYAFRETDRDGVYEADETALGGQHIFLFDGAGNFLRNTDTDASGWYQFTAVPNGAYRVEFSPQSWFGIREDLTPDTAGSLYPRRSIDLTTIARLDFGWRPIVRSTDASTPITTFVGSNGLTVRSYDDVVPAKDVYDRLLSGSLVGTEAQFVTIRFDFVKAGFTSTSATQSNGGPYDGYRAVSDVTYLSWLDGDNELFHEYGHAWSLYYAYIVQQDPSLTAYLGARGLTGDPRVNSSYEWNVRELIAEDYRQLFGTASAQSASQMNPVIAAAPAVPGLKEFLTGTFSQPPH